MDAGQLKQQWTLEETRCFLGIWSSPEVQEKLGRSTRPKTIFQQLQRDMARAGFDRTLEQISNKLKKLKKGYRDHKRDPGRSGKGGPKHRPHYEVLDSVLGDRPQSGTVNSITLETMVEDRLNLQSSTDTGE